MGRAQEEGLIGKRGFFYFFLLLACKPRVYDEAALMVAGVAGR